MPQLGIHSKKYIKHGFGIRPAGRGTYSTGKDILFGHLKGMTKKYAVPVVQKLVEVVSNIGPRLMEMGSLVKSNASNIVQKNAKSLIDKIVGRKSGSSVMNRLIGDGVYYPSSSNGRGVYYPSSSNGRGVNGVGIYIPNSTRGR